MLRGFFYKNENVLAVYSYFIAGYFVIQANDQKMTSNGLG